MDNYHRSLEALNELIHGVKLTLKDLAIISGVNDRNFRYWCNGKKYPSSKSRLKLAKGIRKHAAKMLVTARMLEESVAINYDKNLEPGEMFDRLGTPSTLNKKERQLYRDIMGLETGYRKSKASPWAKFLGEKTRGGLTFREAVDLWNEQKQRGDK